MMNAPRVCIQVQSFYVEAQSQPEEGRFVFAYTITIRNLGRHDVKLLSRYWMITNGNGKQTEVQGEGVIGLQPVIQPGSEFQYTSGAILETPMGTMEGHYQMIDHQGETFQVPVTVFRLAIPSLIH
ncbi:Co2+/Mg2+ efflux protein ApaG [Dickeya chrysanthemi]|uniref:Co2+/Mg2+ efflux protein ApaG n=1 Tax=Dickeya chrysanthemi TaxID=556 RepID=UPI0004838155|nr:Co2+/Mg2+ efflux protein ApaG [Dickeya chrysanthemi]